MLAIDTDQLRFDSEQNDFSRDLESRTDNMRVVESGLGN